MKTFPKNHRNVPALQSPVNVVGGCRLRKNRLRQRYLSESYVEYFKKLFYITPAENGFFHFSNKRTKTSAFLKGLQNFPKHLFRRAPSANLCVCV